MNPADFKLLIHHHDVAYLSNSGEIWLTAGIARWVSALSYHFKEIGLLLHQSAQRLPKQDTTIPEKNVKLISLGPPGHYWDYLSRIQRIRQVCRQAGYQFDGLLIRGLTPRQYVVWQNTDVAHKAFLLVRSPKQNRITKLALMDILSATINKIREFEFSRIARDDTTLLLTNSPIHIPEIEKLSGNKVYFVPTSTILEEEFVPLHKRPVSTPFRLLYCGRIHNLKGLRELFAALAELHQQDLLCVLDLVGAHEEPGYTQLYDLANQLGVVDYICWHGHVRYGPKLLKFYQSADAFILPSYTEGFPRVIWEAAANCCPVIATSVGSMPALLRDKEHALLISPKNVDAIVTAVSCLAVDEALRHHLVEQAYSLAKDFTVEACANNLVNLLYRQWD